MQRILTAAVLLLIFLSAFRSEAADLPRKHPVLLYMLGCDLELETGAATNDLLEIMRTTRQCEVTVIAHIGGSRYWWLPGLSHGCSYDMLISNGNIDILADHGVQACAEEDAFTTFLQQYGQDGADLIFWGHGMSGVDGLGIDAMYDSDTLTWREICSALQSCGLHFRLIGFDACNMASLEAALMLAPYTDYFAASPEEEKLTGWNYPEMLPALSGMDEVKAMTALRERGLQNTGRDPKAMPLTILKESDLLEAVPPLSLILKHACFYEGITVEALARNTPNTEAGETILKMLAGQMLRIDGDESLAALLPDIANEYTSFLRRR